MIERNMNFIILKSRVDNLEMRTIYFCHYFLSLLCETKIWFHHHCLSHHLFSVLKVMFLLLFKEISVKHFDCTFVNWQSINVLLFK